MAANRRPGARAANAVLRKSVVFITIEDETGIANLVIWPNVNVLDDLEIRLAEVLRLVFGK